VQGVSAIVRKTLIVRFKNQNSRNKNMTTIKKTIARNIAILSAVFVTIFSIMLITNYFQVKGSGTIQAEVIETMKQLNYEHADNPEIKEQIRQLDLLARKAYFISHDRLMAGVYILLGMLIILIVALRIFYAEVKNIPDKDIDPIDDWAIKTAARKHVKWIGGGLIAVALIFVFLTSPYLQSFTTNTDQQAALADAQHQSGYMEDGVNMEFSSGDSALSESDSGDVALSDDLSDAASESRENEAASGIVISNVTHNSFRGNNSLGTSSARNIPTSWNLASGNKILWRVPSPRPGHNSPVISGNKVFFSGADENAKELFCYELSTGTELWKLTVANIPGSPSGIPETHEDTGLAPSTVATNGTYVCAIFPSGDVVCADMDGRQLWARNIGVPDNHYGYASSLLMFGNSLLIQYDNRNVKRVMALDLATGNQRWAKERTERQPSWSSPVIANVNNTPQLILVGNPGVTSYNPSTGDQYWRVECMSGEPCTGAAYANGIVFVGSEYATLIAINAADGSVLWRNNEFLPEIASPVATRDFVFVATAYGVVASFNAQTGEIIKYMELNTSFDSSPIIVDVNI
jgi:outer membrane protein assembly factor BamB